MSVQFFHHIVQLNLYFIIIIFVLLSCLPSSVIIDIRDPTIYIPSTDLSFRLPCFHTCTESNQASYDIKRWLNNPSELGIYRPHSSARVNDRTLPSPRSCHEPGSNSHPLGHEPSTVPHTEPPGPCTLWYSKTTLEKKMSHPKVLHMTSANKYKGRWSSNLFSWYYTN